MQSEECEEKSTSDGSPHWSVISATDAIAYSFARSSQARSRSITSARSATSQRGEIEIGTVDISRSHILVVDPRDRDGFLPIQVQARGCVHKSAQRFCLPLVERRASAMSQRNLGHNGAMQISMCMIVTALGDATHEDTGTRRTQCQRERRS